MEDIISQVMVATAGGASAILISNYAERSVLWLKDKFLNHNEIAQKKAAENSLAYLNQLAEKVKKLEERSISDHITLNQALEEPDTSLLLQKSLILASTTSNPLKHALLSDLILKRLESNNEDYLSLIANQACDIIGSLSSDHIRILALLSGVYIIGPHRDDVIESKAEYERIVIDYISLVCKGNNSINSMTDLSFKHLEGVSCLSVSIGSADFFKLINNKVKSNNFQVTADHFDKFDWWPKFIDAWNSYLCHAALTSTGILLGSLAFAQITKINVNLKF